MSPIITAQHFITKWNRVSLNERATAQEHFIDLCHLLGAKTPNEADPAGKFYRFEKPLTKVGGGAGYADVWHKDKFAWEYKTKGKYKNLAAAYQQLLLYKGDLENPPVLVACDLEQFEVHIEFTGYRSSTERFANADLQNASTRELLHLAFTDVEQLRPRERTTTITEEAAARFARVAQLLEQRGYAPAQIAPFFMKVLFALFAEDIRLLPAELLTRSIRQSIFNADEFPDRVRSLFRAMRDGGYFGLDRIPRFNGGLFTDDDIIPLNATELQYLMEVANLDWSRVEPAIFGTLLERSLDPRLRAQLGAHYTSKDDILLVVEPVLMSPLRREWATAKGQVEILRPLWENATGAGKQRLRGQMEEYIFSFMERLAQTKVCDPASGSGNFLCVALHQLKDLEKEVHTYATGVGLTEPELSVTPAQFYGIEKNLFAAQLSHVVVWISYLQWNYLNGFWGYEEPILQRLDTIQCQDAILAIDLHGNLIEPEWPEVDVIVGNPPFLGDRKMRSELGDAYVEAIRELYAGRFPGVPDLVCYWFERTRAMLEAGKIKRAGLLATNSIRNGASRRILDRIKQTGDIFMAWSDRPWTLDGAAVRISIIGFDNGSERIRYLDGRAVQEINADLTASIDLTKAKQLSENKDIAFAGTKKYGPFDIEASVAEAMLAANDNPEHRSNSDVIKPWVNGADIVGRKRGMWIIDFGIDMSLAEAVKYVAPFNYVRQFVKPERAKVRSQKTRELWWLFERTRPELRQATADLERFIATVQIGKYRLFVWLKHPTIPDQRLIVIARDDDYFFGLLHSKMHELWALHTGSSLGETPCYTPTTTFETYPFPWPPSHEPHSDPRVEAIAAAARHLVALRDVWLNPPDLDESALKKRILTNLYNLRPDWLTEAHCRLDAAVFAAYGWPADLSDDEILARLLALNVERAACQNAAPSIKEMTIDED